MQSFSIKKWVPWFLPLVLVFWFFGKKPSEPSVEQVHSTTRLAMGTLVTVSTWGVKGPSEEKAVDRVFTRISQIESLASRQDKSSPVYKINHAPTKKTWPVPEELATIVQKGLEIKKISHGAFDPGLVFLLDLWGFANGVPDVGKIPESQAISSWLENRKNHLEEGIRVEKSPDGTYTLQLDDVSFALDLGAIAKGYALDKAMETMKQAGVANALIIGGGDMVIAGSKGGKPWRIGIQHPRDHDKIMAFSEIVGDMSMATSGDYERFFMVDGERQHHILDPETGRPSRSGLISVSIQAKEGMLADALSTAVFVMGMEKGKAFIEKWEGIEGMLVAENGERWKSVGFKGQWLDGP